jgi:hypothetical protein
MVTSSGLLWMPLLEAAAKTMVGAIGGYAFHSVIDRITSRNLFDGPMDFWKRGVAGRGMTDGDYIVFDGLISPYTQLFPGDPMKNASRYSQLYDFQGKISRTEFQAMEFFAGSDAALRIGSLNGETLIGLYARYGYVGEGLLAVAPTKLVREALPDFFHPDFYGVRAQVYGRIAKCPAQHGFVAQGIAKEAGIDLDLSGYKNMQYLQINAIKMARKAEERVCSLLGSPWAVTNKKSDQYLVQYGYISEPGECQSCIRKITGSKSWESARVFFDDIASPSKSMSFKKQFIT